MANLVDLRHKALAPDGDVEKFTKEAHEVMNEFKEESTHVQGMINKPKFFKYPFFIFGIYANVILTISNLILFLGYGVLKRSFFNFI